MCVLSIKVPIRKSLETYLMILVYIYIYTCLDGWGCKIHRQHLCKGGRLPKRVPGYDTKQSDGDASVMLVLWGMQSTSSLPSVAVPLEPGMVAPDRALSMSQIELNCVLTLNWVAWNKTALTIKLRTYTKLNCLKWNCFCMPNEIVWNRTVLGTETVLKLNWIVWNRTVGI